MDSSTSMKSVELELMQKNSMASNSRKASEQNQDEWDKFLNDSRRNVATVADPQSCEGWRFLRPPCVGAFAAGLEQMIQETTLEEATNKVWIPDPKEGFEEAEIIEKQEDGKTRLYCRQKEVTVATKDLEEMNPACFNFCEDMARLTHLNEASILHNLRQRFRVNLIHTYSGLFCITVNPWRQLPIYTGTVVSMYKGQNQNDMPPHIYAVADTAYSNLLQAQENQSILITGESGAGKTENTKKILQYFAAIASSATGKDSKTSLEKQILETNPVLESFGNAKTLHNDNSSRFGKFIRIKFDSQGKVSGAEIESYLLEKSRVIAQSSNERSYHIFYQLLSGGMPELKESLTLTAAPADYRFIMESAPKIQGINDAAEMIRTDKALTTLGFSQDEKTGLYQMTAAVLLMGEMKFVQRSAGDQAFPSGVKESAAVCHLLGLNLHKFLDCLTEPTVTVGEEVIKRGQNLEQVLYSVSAVAKAVYEKSFRWLVKRCNKTIEVRTGEKASNDIGVLDIAGFEIFALNSFEQLCINYTNERLQQFFNNHMFIREQEEYQREHIIWDYIDYGMDLQPTIDLIDKPLGIFSMLEEECIMPKGSDRGFSDKLLAQHLGKTSQFGKPKLSKKAGMQGDFSIMHYAGLVNYNVEGWIDKNKDPLNECITSLFKNSENPLFSHIWRKYGSLKSKGDSRRRGSFSFLTVSIVYRDQLGNLVKCLNKTQPHFVRCIVPNYEKKPGCTDNLLVLFQLRCNGVLEGIRICRQGYPNRMIFEDFKNRYRILDSANVNLYTDPREAAGLICKAVQLEMPDDYQMGITKVFCRAGIFGKLEDCRTKRLSEILSGIQSQIRWHLTQKVLNSLWDKHEAVLCLQANIRCWVSVQQWPWWKLMCQIKQMVQAPMEELKQEVEDLKSEKEVIEDKLNTTENENFNLKKDIYRLENEVDEIIENSKTQERELDNLKKEMENREDTMDKMHKNISKQAEDIENLKSKMDKEKNAVEDLRCANGNLEHEIEQLEKNLKRERKSRENLEETNAESGSQLRNLQKELEKLQQTKNSLQAVLSSRDEKTDFLNKMIADLRKKVRKLQEEISQQQERIDQLESALLLERGARRRAEKHKADLEDDVQDLKVKLARSVKNNDSLMDQNQAKDKEIEKLKSQMGKEAELKEQTLEELRKRHSTSALQFQQQLEQLHKKTLKLEGENQQLKGQIDQNSWLNDPTRYRSFARRRHSIQTEPLNLYQNKIQDSMTKSYSSLKSSSSSNILTKRLEELEKEVKELQLDKRMKKREIEVYIHTLQEETAEKDALTKQVRLCLDEIEKLNHQLIEEEEQKNNLARQLHKSHAEVNEWRTKCQEKLVDREAEFSDEKKKLKKKLSDATQESAAIAAKLSTAERASTEYQEEIRERETELDRARTTLLAFEKIQKGQEKALDQWNAAVKELTCELDGLKEENTKLKIELRHFKREHHEFDDCSEVGGLTDSGRESVDEESVLKKLETALSEKTELEEQLKRERCDGSSDSQNSDKIKLLQVENERLVSEKRNLNEEIDRLHRICHELNASADINSIEPEVNSIEPEVNSIEPETNSIEPEVNSIEPDKHSSKSDDDVCSNFSCDFDAEMTIHLPTSEDDDPLPSSD